MNRMLNCLGLVSLLTLTGCGAAGASGAEAEEKPLPTEVISTPAPTPEGEAPAGEQAASWMPAGTEVLPPETEPLPLLADVIAETYGIPEEERENTRYCYNYTDLNGDGTEELFALVMGMYTSGSGGDSGLLVLPYAGMSVSQTFTLLRGPILISDHTTDGTHDLVYLRSGGGAEPELVTLSAVDGVYGNPADAPVLDSTEGLTGTAILGADLLDEAQAGAFHTLAD